MTWLVDGAVNVGAVGVVPLQPACVNDGATAATWTQFVGAAAKVQVSVPVAECQVNGEPAASTGATRVTPAAGVAVMVIAVPPATGEAGVAV